MLQKEEQDTDMESCAGRGMEKQVVPSKESLIGSISDERNWWGVRNSDPCF